jgi:hypothetical protein
MKDDPGSRRQRIVATAAGVFLYVAFWGIGQTTPGLGITYHPPFNNSSPGEIYFWLAHALLVFPGACLLGFGLSPRVAPLLRRLSNAAAGFGARKDLAALLAIGLVGTVCFRLLHHFVLLDFPITDDEYGVRFGGQLLASGMLRAPTLGLDPFIPTFTMHVKDGLMSSFDWLGPQLAWALGEKTGIGGSWVHALVAAVPLVVVPAWVGRCFGRSWAALALLFFLFSPMAFALSMTTHAHLLSRACLALGLWCYWEAGKRQAFRWWAVCGLALGAGFLCRPFETFFIALPLLVDTLLGIGLRKPGAARAAFGLLVGGIGPVVLFAVYNYAFSGDPFLPPRFMPGGWGQHDLDSLEKTWTAEVIWNRFGTNTGYNLLMLGIWFLGPLGIALVSAGVLVDRFTKLLGLGVLSVLLLGLLHDDHGIHSVGPIHYSECAVPLTFISVAGLKRLADWLRNHGLDTRAPTCCVLLATLVGLGTFNLWNSLALREQAQIQHGVYGFLEASGIGNAVVLGDQFAQTWSQIPEYQSVGSWVFEWRPPRPDFSDDILIFHASKGAKRELAAAFPDRTLFRLTAHDTRPLLRLERMD